MANKSNILKWVFTSLWIAVGAGVMVLLVAAIKKEEGEKCAGVNIVIKGVSNNFFVDKNDILNELNQYIDGSPQGQPLAFFNLKALEADLQRNIWIKKSQLFFDNNRVLQIIVTEREPAARVFTKAGTTFYIDSSIAMLPLSEKFSARLPVFTGFPSDKAVLQKNDSALLKDVYNISMAIQSDSFIMALVEQVDITPERLFEMVPKMGEGIIAFGDGGDIEKKFNKLKLFYQQVMPKSGWSHYSRIDVQYNGQVLAKRKGAEDKSADSLGALRIMELNAQIAEQFANDSIQLMLQDNDRNTTSANLVEQSLQRDDDEPQITDASPVVKIIDQSIGGSVLTGKPAAATAAPAKKTGSADKSAVAKTADKTTTTAKPVARPAVPKPAATKPQTKKTTTVINKPKPVPVKSISDKPKAVMPKEKQNDY